MRHRVKSKRLNRKHAPLKALIRNLATSLVLHGKIQTTEQKAKMVRPVVEKIITTAKKKPEREAIRDIQKVLFQEEASRKMLTEMKTRYETKTSGFTRIIPIGIRKGDASALVQLELTSPENS